jgi:hypothetical protein
MNDLPYQISKAAMCSSFGGRRRRHYRQRKCQVRGGRLSVDRHRAY